MNKKQLIKNLKEKFYKVGLPEGAEKSEKGYLLRAKEGVMWYLVGVYEKVEDVLIRRNISIYCEFDKLDKEQRGHLNWEDLPEGNYFYGEKYPAPMIQTPVENPFKDVEGEVERQTDDYVVVKRFVEEAGQAVEKRFLVREDKELPIK